MYSTEQYYGLSKCHQISIQKTITPRLESVLSTVANSMGTFDTNMTALAKNIENKPVGRHVIQTTTSTVDNSIDVNRLTKEFNREWSKAKDPEYKKGLYHYPGSYINLRKQSVYRAIHMLSHPNRRNHDREHNSRPRDDQR